MPSEVPDSPETQKEAFKRIQYQDGRAARRFDANGATVRFERDDTHGPDVMNDPVRSPAVGCTRVRTEGGNVMLVGRGVIVRETEPGKQPVASALRRMFPDGVPPVTIGEPWAGVHDGDGRPVPTDRVVEVIDDEGTIYAPGQQFYEQVNESDPFSIAEKHFESAHRSEGIQAQLNAA